MLSIGIVEGLKCFNLVLLGNSVTTPTCALVCINQRNDKGSKPLATIGKHFAVVFSKRRLLFLHRRVFRAYVAGPFCQSLMVVLVAEDYFHIIHGWSLEEYSDHMSRWCFQSI